MSIYYQDLYTVTNSNYGKVYKNKEMIEIDQEYAGIARIVEAEIQQAQILEEYEICFGKTKEIGSSNISPRLSLEYGRNFIRKSISNRYNKKVLEISALLVSQGESIMEENGKNRKSCFKWEQQPITSNVFYYMDYQHMKVLNLPIQLDNIRIIVPCYITNHESDHNLILGNLFLNSLEDYSIGKNGIEISYKNETCFIAKNA
ncbi:hypothetical protein H5410_060443 [Solanum commersonii]|uniref:Uncharacterized protein n=1 Tax=Solanum commersonii TaxID=4109 RepID=A0A9J5W536_SOLCO|nr:hypothetical protein H5410_060443 [Solanum commersonii]